MTGFVNTIDDHRLLVEKHIHTSESNEAQQARSDSGAGLRDSLKAISAARRQIEEDFRKLDADEIRRRRFDVLTWLSAPDAASDQDHHRVLRNDSGRWLLQNARYQSWSVSHTDAIPLLWVRGMPGSGM